MAGLVWRCLSAYQPYPPRLAVAGDPVMVVVCLCAPYSVWSFHDPIPTDAVAEACAAGMSTVAARCPPGLDRFKVTSPSPVMIAALGTCSP